MKKLFSFIFVSFMLMTSCEKDEFVYTGSLKMTFKISNNTDYSNIVIDIYTMDNLDYTITSVSPDNTGVFTKDLLPGNYRSSVYYHGNRANPTFQIINGKETSFDFDF